MSLKGWWTSVNFHFFSLNTQTHAHSHVHRKRKEDSNEKQYNRNNFHTSSSSIIILPKSNKIQPLFFWNMKLLIMQSLMISENQEPRWSFKIPKLLYSFLAFFLHKNMQGVMISLHSFLKVKLQNIFIVHVTVFTH